MILSESLARFFITIPGQVSESLS